jgi:predicted deacetylase
MRFRIAGLSPDLFRHLFGLSDEALAMQAAKRIVVDEQPGFPDRIEMRDAAVGETMLLVNYTHQPADTPYRASHAVFVREGAETAYDRLDEVPEVMRRRVISLRGFDAAHFLVSADIVAGESLDDLIAQFFANPNVAYLHAHYAKPGCYAARVDRA